MNKLKRRMNLFYIPALLIMLFFVAYPLFQTLQRSFYQWNGYSANMKFIGIENYLEMFSDDKFWGAFRNTIIYGFGSTLLQNVFGLLVALLVNTRFKGNGIVRVIVYLPVMISGLIMGYIMYFFFSFDNGILNDIIGLFGIAPIDWLSNPVIGIISITLINSWQYVGLCMIVYLAGLQSISKSYYEAAAIDGVSPWGRFRYITLPLLMPSITSAVIVNLIGGLKLYDVVASLTNGGPVNTTHSLSTYISYQYFNAERAGYSAAIGIVVFLLILVVSNIGNSFFAKREVEM